MASFAHTIRSFQSGVLSREELFAEVDRILQGARANEKWLLETLDEENTKVPLPPDVHTAVVERIEKAVSARNPNDSGETAADAREPIDPDLSQTRLATSLFVNQNASAPAAGAEAATQAINAGIPAAAIPATEVETMKGTGDVLNDRFVLEECIGAGGMSTVYKALDRRRLEANDRNPYVAVKVLNVEFRAHPDSLIALQREAKKSQSLAHPNIVRVYDFDRDGPTVYMTMEYLPGKSLAQILRAPDFKGLPHEEALRILEAVASALIFAHDNGIVHADFKPANVILTDTGQVKVIDFGIARAFQRPDQTDMEVTRFDPGSLGALTPTYASPEMLELREPDPRDDIYALACITYEMLTGRHPFGRMQATEARKGGLQVERRKGLTRRQWKALKAGLDFDREKRTQEVRKFLSEFRPERSASGAPFSMVAGVGALLVVAAVAAVGYFYKEPLVGPIADMVAPDKSMDLATLDVDQTTAVKSAAPSTQNAKTAVAPAGPKAKPTESPKGVDSATLAKATAPAPAPVKPKASKPPVLSLKAVMPLIDPIPCSAMEVSVKDGSIKLHGYVSKRFELQSLEKDLMALPGARKVDSDLKRVDVEKCEIVELYAPFWLANRAAGGDASIQLKNKASELTEGDSLIVQVTTPPYDSFVNVDYFSLDGGVVHMLPGPRAKANQAPPNYEATIGDLGEWTIAEPFGTEMIAVLVTPRPLFKALRDEYETKADYLAAVKQELKRIEKESGKDKIKADFVMVNTKPRSDSLLQRLREKTLGRP